MKSGKRITVTPETIDQVIRSANNGDTIILTPGTCQGPIRLRYGLSIEGQEGSVIIGRDPLK